MESAPLLANTIVTAKRMQSADKCQMSTNNRNKFQITGQINICLSQLDGGVSKPFSFYSLLLPHISLPLLPSRRSIHFTRQKLSLAASTLAMLSTRPSEQQWRPFVNETVEFSVTERKSKKKHHLARKVIPSHSRLHIRYGAEKCRQGKRNERQRHRIVTVFN